MMTSKDYFLSCMILLYILHLFSFFLLCFECIVKNRLQEKAGHQLSFGYGKEVLLVQGTWFQSCLEQVHSRFMVYIGMYIAQQYVLGGLEDEISCI